MEQPVASASRERPSEPPDSGAGRGAHVYKMKDLCDKAGVSRQLVHFYIQQGLLPEGKKTGKNMAYYTEQHLERLLLVRKLQHEHFLPLKAIRALLEERDEAFSPAQRRHMRDVRAAMPESLTGPPGPRPTVDVDALAGELGLTAEDVGELVEAGLLAIAEEQDLPASGRAAAKGGARRMVIAGDEAWRLSHYAQMRAAGFTRERGFTARDLAIYDEAVQRLVIREARIFASRLGSLSPAEAAELLEKAMPVVASLLGRLHTEKARHLFATL